MHSNNATVGKDAKGKRLGKKGIVEQVVPKKLSSNEIFYIATIISIMMIRIIQDFFHRVTSLGVK